jgi:FKBP-type peptidyl-prolyl cis-trans isomerase FkpA
VSKRAGRRWGRSYNFPIVLRGLSLLPCLLALLALACSSAPPPGTSTITQLVSVDEKEGTGTEAMFGSEVLVHYTGWLYDENRNRKRGREFDSSRDRNDPLAFKIGAGEVIKGWEEGVIGMKVGGRRVLTIPPDMAHAKDGLGELIPPDATLIFDVELIEVK